MFIVSTDMDNLSSTWLEELLNAVGSHLEAQKSEAAIVVVGGATLSVLGIVDRTTKDVDVIAQATRDDDDSWTLTPPVPLPEVLQKAVALVGRDYGLAADWLNTEVGAQWRQGLPDSILQDMEWRQYTALWVGFAGRQTLITLKLFAAVDRSPESVHYQDLLALQPTPGELATAERWVVGQDTSEHFPILIQDVISHVRRDLQGD